MSQNPLCAAMPVSEGRLSPVFEGDSPRREATLSSGDSVDQLRRRTGA